MDPGVWRKEWGESGAAMESVFVPMSGNRVPSVREQTGVREKLERATGVEPASEAWEASILPMNYARKTLP